MVVLSFVIQVFLLLTGCLRLRSINELLRVSIWLAYVAADFVAVYALGLFSQYEEKYRLGRHSFGDASPLIWVPFLLVHLGGQDSITAYSLEDNNLWLRHLLNLVVQATLAIYVFSKSIHRINSDVVIPAAFVFVAGIIKYGERIWALRIGSRDGLGISSLKYMMPTEEQPPEETNPDDIYSTRATALYALQIVHLAQGLFVGRTILQLGNEAKQCFEKYFKTHGEAEEKLKIIQMELGMMFDLLYTKAMVLQRRSGRLLRRAAQISMVLAFVLFLQAERRPHNANNRANTVISYTLFVGAIFIEACSIAMEIASPWTRVHLKEGAFLRILSRSSKALSHMKSSILQCNKMQWLSSNYSIGQYNAADHDILHASTSKVACMVINALRLGKQWKNLKYHQRVDAQGIAKYFYFVEWFDKSAEERFNRLRWLGPRLNYTLCLPLRHAIYRLHIYTDLHISRHFKTSDKSNHGDDVMVLKEQCEKLSNYMWHLTGANPSMVPVDVSVDDGKIGPETNKKKKTCGRLKILEEAAKALFKEVEPESACPFENVGDLKQSLEDIREVWTRLLVYAAGKCSAELHARQLARGGELLTFVWLLMLHHGLGDAATEVKLLTSNDPRIAELGSVVSQGIGNFVPRPEQPRYAFDFCAPRRSGQADGPREGQLLQVVRTMQYVVPRFLAKRITETGQQMIGDLMNIMQQVVPGEQDVTTMSDAAEQDDGAGTSDNAEEETGEGTSREIGEEVVVASEVERQEHQEAQDSSN
ncbi:unnamed protein product [Urochloa decumbens]|uniref:DUF4220 domain-containing protein n=1 Tax=Urochloa decumbens TaxID=240449 RepID=A0ABC9BXW8_9POAL